MNFEMNEDQVLLQNGVRRFLADRYDFESRRKRLDSNTGVDRAMWSQFAEMGWLSLVVPEQHGGLGWPLANVAILLQEFGRGLVAEPYLEAAMLSANLLAAADAPSSGPLLSKIATGEALIAVALAEAGSRYETEHLLTTAEPDGEGHRLNGRKILVAGADAADYVLVSARLEGAVALFATPADAAGLTRTAYRTVDGGWASDIRFDNVRLAADALLARDRRASVILSRALDEAALGAGAEAIGCMDRILEITVDYLRVRKQFGQRLADFQVLQHRIADLFVEIEMARSALFSALSAIDSAPDEREAAVSAARVRIDQAAHRVGNQGIHLHGGMGMTMEYPVGHYYRRLLMLARQFGDTEHHFERYERLKVEA